MVLLLTDTFRWWGSVGAFLAFILIAEWLNPLSKAGPKVLPRHSRVLAGAAMLFTMLSIMLAGTIIPFADDGRIANFDRTDMGYLTVMMIAWLGWASAAWLCAVALTEWKRMLAGSVCWFICCIFAADWTVGALM